MAQPIFESLIAGAVISGYLILAWTTSTIAFAIMLGTFLIGIVAGLLQKNHF